MASKPFMIQMTIPVFLSKWDGFLVWDMVSSGQRISLLLSFILLSDTLDNREDTSFSYAKCQQSMFFCGYITSAKRFNPLFNAWNFITRHENLFRECHADFSSNDSRDSHTKTFPFVICNSVQFVPRFTDLCCYSVFQLKCFRWLFHKIPFVISCLNPNQSLSNCE